MMCTAERLSRTHTCIHSPPNSSPVHAPQCSLHCLQGRHGFDPWVGKFPWRMAWRPTPVFLPGKSHRQESLVGYISWR